MSYLPRPYDSYADPNNAYNALPKVGQTRCYWAMLSAALEFIYLDPVLASHLQEQAPLLTGKSLISFVHPDEQASANHDLGGVLQSRTLHGSVTRVRFSRLSRVRRLLGYDGPGPNWAQAEKIALDKDYMAVDIVINWAADGLVLCFIHATTDLNANADNDEAQKTDWTNWCGTPWMPPEEVDNLYRRLLMCIQDSGSMSPRVFQILLNERERPLLLSWPPDSAQTEGPTSRDYAKLVENVQIGAGVPGGNDAKTSCTRRYKALQNMPPAFGCQVESIFIPHGTIIFACHKVDPLPRSTTATTTPMHQLDYGSATYNGSQNPAYYEQGPTDPYTDMPPSPQTAAYSNGFVTPNVQSPYSPQRWNQGSLSASMGSLRSDPYANNASHPAWSSAPPLPPPPPPYLDGSPAPAFERLPPQDYTSYSPTAASTTSAGTSPASDVVPPPRRRISPGSTRDHSTGPIRANSNRPMGVQKCSSCKTTSSPEWRKGPTGKKELCNACGLRYARSRAKKEGSNPSNQRRRKDKNLLGGAAAKRESATPPLSASSANSPYSVVRRSYGDSSFSSSAGSASGSDIYPGHHVLDNMTPSPSPSPVAPTHNSGNSGMGFVHYTSGGENRPPYSTTSAAAGAFYSVPSPLSTSHPPVVHSSHHPHPHPQTPASHHTQQHQQQHHGATTHLPPLGQLSAYAGRLSPMVPTASPLSQSSLPSPMPLSASSYERERDRDYRDLPPTPLSAESRRRSILTQQ